MTQVFPEVHLKVGPNVDNEKVVTELVQEVLKSPAPVSVKSLKGGITNQLLLVEQTGLKLLVRAFGKGTGSFIDREREYAVHQQLQTLGLAPKLYAQFGNGLIYEFIPGTPPSALQLSKPDVMKQVSRRLAQWHAALKPQEVSHQLPSGLAPFWTVLEKWVDLCPENVLPLSGDALKAEFQTLKKRIETLGGVEVMGHCDLLSANILLQDDLVSLLPSAAGTPDQSHSPSLSKSASNSSLLEVADRISAIQSATENLTPSTYNSTTTLHVPGHKPMNLGLPEAPVGTEPEISHQVSSNAAFIDYEYSIPCPRAFDIANHFQEWQGYECHKHQVPEPTADSEKLSYWCSEYLKAYGLLTNTHQQLSELVTELQAYWGMPGFYWGVWSAIQSQSSDIDFNYRDYASSRFQEYLDWKEKWQQ